MAELKIFHFILLFSFLCALAVFITLFFISAPYGRHTRRGWGYLIPNQLGWLVMEAPSPVMMAIMFWIGDAPKSTSTIIFFLLWQAHYIHRAFIYPFRIADGRKKMPLVVTALAFTFNLGNGYTNGRYLFHFSGGYPDDWLIDPRFILGLILFIAGYAINRWADLVLRRLRQPGEIGYKIPQGGLYRWISCPNYFGEVVEWSGWALATWSLPGLAFAIWTAANLIPRAYTHHRWYQEYFRDYPPERKAFFPFI